MSAHYNVTIVVEHVGGATITMPTLYELLEMMGDTTGGDGHYDRMTEWQQLPLADRRIELMFSNDGDLVDFATVSPT